MKNGQGSTKDPHFPMSQLDFKNLGRDDVAYVKKYIVNGKDAFVLHAADGTALAVQNTPDAALTSADHHDLDVIAVH